MTARAARCWRRLAAASVLAVPLAGPVAGVGAQTDGGFPAAVSALVYAGPEPSPADVVAFYRDPAVPPAEPVLVVELARPVLDLPEGSRVSAVVGVPGEVQRRTTLIVEAGAVRGELEEGEGGAFAPVEGAEPPAVAVTAAGHARLPLQPAAGDVVTIETETPDGTRATSPAFPLSQVIEAAGGGALTPAPFASVLDDQRRPTGELVELPAVPILEVENQGITVRTTQPVPAEVGGVAVVEVVDSLRIVPDFDDPGDTPYLVSVNHREGSVTFFDATGGFPAAVEAPEELWLIDGIDGEDDETTSITLDRAGLLAGAELPADADVAIGLSRVVALEDGRYLGAEGATAQLSWFGAATGGEAAAPTTSTVAPTTARPSTVTATPEPTEEEGPNATVLIAAAVVAAALGGIALYASRQNRKALADPDSALGAMAKVVDKASHDTGEGEVEPDAAEAPRARAGAPTVRVPGARDRAVAEAVGVRGARAAVTRDARARQGASASAGDDAPGSGRDALWAAMRRKAAEAERAAQEGAEPGAADLDGGDAEAGDAEAGDAEAGDAKSTRPDDALDALNRFIEDLRLPGDGT